MNGVEFVFTLSAYPNKESKLSRRLPRAAREIYLQMAAPRVSAVSSLTARKIGEGIPIVIIEDSDFIHMAWIHQIKDGGYQLFYSPEDFFRAAESDPVLFEKTKFFLVDFDFGQRSTMDGFKCAERLRSKTKGKIFLYSEIELDELPGCFDMQIEKKIFELKELQQLTAKI